MITYVSLLSLFSQKTVSFMKKEALSVLFADK